MIDFETWWNSSSADEFRRLNDDMDGRVVRPVWDAAIRATLSSQKATSAAPSPEATQPTQAGAPSEFPLSAWQTMEYAKGALNAMLTHMGMDEDEWNKPSFEQARSAVRTLEYQLQRPDQVALWKARYQSLKGPLSKFHEQAVAAGLDGVGAALAALATQQAVQGEPVAWREHVEQRIRTWRQRTMNRSGDRLAIDDFMGQDSIDDLVDFVCDEYATPPAPGQVERDREDADYLCKLVDAIGKDVLGVLKQYGDAQAAIGLMASRTKDAIRAARSSEGGSND